MACAVQRSANYTNPARISEFVSDQERHDILVSGDDTKIIDIDQDVSNELMCPEYATEIIKNLRLDELNNRPRIDYMENVQEWYVTPQAARVEFVDWLFNHAEFVQDNEAIHLALRYLDRYLSHNKVDYDSLKLVGLACLTIAEKYHDDCGCKLNYCRLAIEFSSDQILAMEREILYFSDYNLCTPTAVSFLGRFLQAGLAGNEALFPELHYLADYIAEFSLYLYDVLRFLPSVVAASSVFLAKYILVPSKRPWNATLEHYTRYRPSELRDCVTALHELYCRILELYYMSSITERFSRLLSVCDSITMDMPAKIPPHYFKDLSC